MPLKKTLFILVLIPSIILSQKIYISSAYTENGQPVGLVKNNLVEKNKTYSIILNSGENKFTEHIVFLIIEKQGNENRLNRFAKLLRTEDNKNWVAYNYSFTEPGVYDVYFTDYTRHNIAETTVSVDSKTKPSQEILSKVESRGAIDVVFCEKIIGGNPINHRTSLSMIKDNGFIYIYIADVNPLGTDKILLNMWRNNGNGSTYDEYIDTKKYKIDPTWTDTYFKYRFLKPGDYKINFFNAKEILLKTAYITVTK